MPNKISDITYHKLQGQVEIKKKVSRSNFYEKESGWEIFLLFSTFLLFPIECFVYTLLPFPRDKLEFLGQILRTYDGHGEDDAYKNICFYCTWEFRIYLELPSVSVGIKTCPC